MAKKGHKHRRRKERQARCEEKRQALHARLNATPSAESEAQLRFKMIEGTWAGTQFGKPPRHSRRRQISLSYSIRGVDAAFEQQLRVVQQKTKEYQNGITRHLTLSMGLPILGSPYFLLKTPTE